MKNITKILSEEHQNILKVINAIIDECEELKTGKKLNPDYFQKAIVFIKDYADTFHHSKEEDILFKIMLENADGLHCNPIPVMLHEHDAGREFVRGMEDGLKDENLEKLIENAEGYCHLLNDHIYKEDNILYPMAEDAISDEQKEIIIEKYAAVKSDHFTEEVLQNYLNSL